MSKGGAKISLATRDVLNPTDYSLLVTHCLSDKDSHVHR